MSWGFKEKRVKKQQKSVSINDGQNFLKLDENTDLQIQDLSKPQKGYEYIYMNTCLCK